MAFARKRRENRAKLQVELFSTCFKRGLSRRAEASPELCNCRAERSFAVAQDDNEDRILKYHPEIAAHARYNITINNTDNTIYTVNTKHQAEFS